MQIRFHGKQSAEEAAESLLSIFKMFQERYGIKHYREIYLDVTFLDTEGHDVELVDASTSEVLGVFEVYKSGEYERLSNEPPIRLVIDNTKKKSGK